MKEASEPFGGPAFFVRWRRLKPLTDNAQHPGHAFDVQLDSSDWNVDEWQEVADEDDKLRQDGQQEDLVGPKQPQVEHFLQNLDCDVLLIVRRFLVVGSNAVHASSESSDVFDL